MAGAVKQIYREPLAVLVFYNYKSRRVDQRVTFEFFGTVLQFVFENCPSLLKSPLFSRTTSAFTGLLTI